MILLCCASVVNQLVKMSLCANDRHPTILSANNKKDNDVNVNWQEQFLSKLEKNIEDC